MEDVLPKLCDRFVQRCVNERAQIEEMMKQWQATEDRLVQSELVRLVHGIAGTGGTLGYWILSERAAEAEAQLDTSSIPFDGMHAISKLLAELDAVIRGARNVF